MNTLKNNIKAEIVILTIDNIAMLKRCLDSIQNSTLIAVRVIIIDNGGGKAIKEYLSSLRDSESISYKVIHYERNIGFVRGNNEAMKLTSAPYVCLLNDDTIVTRRWLSGMIRAMEDNRDIGIVNPSSNTLGVSPARGEDLDSLSRRLRESGEKVCNIGTASGFCMLIKRDVIQKIGYFDEEIDTAFFEDSDYSLRAKEAGYRCVVTNQGYVFHEEHKSFNRVEKIEDIFKKNRDWFYNKWGRSLRIAIALNENREGVFSIMKKLTDQDNFITLFLKDDSAKNIKMTNCKILIRKKLFILRLFFSLLFKFKKPYDILIVSDPGLLKRVCRLRKIINKPLYFLIRKDEYSQKVFSMADRLIFTSANGEEEFIRKFPGQKNKVLKFNDISRLRKIFSNQE